MRELPDDPQSISQFLDFINNQLDLSGLDRPPLTEEQIEQVIMPLIRSDIYTQTLRLVDQLLRQPGRDHWRAQLAPFHREVRQCLAQTLVGMLDQRYPDRMSEAEWSDMATFIITIAWLVRKQMDGDEVASDN
jgi:hypothetical protein